MPTNEEQLKKYYAAAQGNDLRADDSAFGVTPNGGSNYGGNKMRRDPFAQNSGAQDSGATGAAGAADIGTVSVETGQAGSSGIPSEWTKPAKPGSYGNSHNQGLGYPRPNGNNPQDYWNFTGQRPNGGDQGGNQVGVRPGRPENPWHIPGTGGVQKPGNVAGTESTTPGAAAGPGETGGAAADTGTTGTTGGIGTTGGAESTGTTGTKSVLEWYRDYLNKLGGYDTPSAKDQSDLVREMYEENLAANKSQLESDYNQNLSDLESEASKIGSTYYEQQRQAQAESDRNRQAFQEYANARGLNSGTGGQAELARNNQLSANLNSLRQSEAEKRAEVERQRVLLGQQYQSAIQKAQADNDLAKAKALYEEAVRVDESISSAAKADADRALQMFNILNNTALSAAGAYASQTEPDLSLYAKLLGGGGSSSAELTDLYNKAQSILSSGGYHTSSGGGGGGSSGGSTFKKATSDEIEWAEYYINIINRAGGIDNVQDYLATNYKSYGIPYQSVSRTTASMAEKAKGYSTNKYTIGSQKGKDIANSLGTGNTYQAADGSVWRKSSNGKIYVTKDGVEMEAQIT